nr:putative DNA helicase Ino80 [Onthophagus taurus]
MDPEDGDPMLSSSSSKPILTQKIESATNITVFLEECQKDMNNLNSDEDTVRVDHHSGSTLNFTNGEDGNDSLLFNVDNVDFSRNWLTEILQEDVIDKRSNPANELADLMKLQKKKNSCAGNTKKIEMNKYYSTGLLSNHDKYNDNKKVTSLKYPKKRLKQDESPSKQQPLYMLPEVLRDTMPEDSIDFDLDHTIELHHIEESNVMKPPEVPKEPPQQKVTFAVPAAKKPKAKKFKDDESKQKWEEMMLAKRKKIFSAMVKKEINKQQRAKVNKHKEMLIQCKKIALQCQKVVRNKALQSARAVKELQWRMKRLARENLAYWKRSKRVDREMRRKLEKEAEEQRKMDFELIEAKRQQRKLNFLITQTELYAHFMSKKIGDTSPEEQLRILSQLDEEKHPRLAAIDDYDSEIMKSKAIKNAQDAFRNERARTQEFDRQGRLSDDTSLDTDDGEFTQPTIFQGTLKAYQLRGMNWLANLYDQGISGILADEMGLGKTVQSIAFLTHLAEKHDLWGPFLVICPASTLHNWQQEFAKFVPAFKVVPYWGNPADRKILRQFWNHDGMHTKDGGFHIVITSYQIVISDVKYFNRIKWQYMVLDEAQAIKSTNSMRWKTLLGFNCRNRLLLSGTPIQNSMAELWALLHFIMPTLFDSHEEFNEWFSKDIESHAENKTGIDEKHLSRLHMILKPFMLRRIKKDVENELSDKIEVMLYCPLTTRQKLLYMALKQKIRIEDLLHYTVGGGGGDSHNVDKNFTSNLMNLVMQFRKVCNHPELFERRDAKSPIFLNSLTYNVPYEIFDFNVRQETFQKIKLFCFNPVNINDCLKSDKQSIFIFLHSIKISIGEASSIFNSDILKRWQSFFEITRRQYNNAYRYFYSGTRPKYLDINVSSEFKMSPASIDMSPTLRDLVFTRNCTGKQVFYTFVKHLLLSMPETIEHRNIRYKNIDDNKKAELNDLIYEERKPQIFDCTLTEIPSFLFSVIPKVTVNAPQLFCPSRRVAHHWARHVDDWSLNSLNYHFCNATNQNLSRKSSVSQFHPIPRTALDNLSPMHGWSHITIPDKETLVTDSGKLSVLDGLLKRLKEEGHRVLIYSQMTKMIDLLEEYMWHRHHKYMRLDGSSKISERRDMVADFQARTDIFVFLLSTRAGGLGINLTAADTVIFYDSDWNPTVDQQAMDRAHRLGQTKQVTVYRLICKGSIEERILERAREKSEIQKLVISGGNFKPDTLKPKEVVSLLLDDEEIEQKYRQRAEERRHLEDMREMDRKRKYMASTKANITTTAEKLKKESQESGYCEGSLMDSTPNSPLMDLSMEIAADEIVENDLMDVDCEWTTQTSKPQVYSHPGPTKPRNPGRGASKRGRPRGSRRVSALGRFNSTSQSTPSTSSLDSSQEQTKYNSSYMFEAAVPTSSTPETRHSSSSSVPSTSAGNSGTTPAVRRGPGRPRLKPSGPAHQGSRGSYRPRKPAKPLPVPLPSDGNSTTTHNNSLVSGSTYLYNFSEQSDS